MYGNVFQPQNNASMDQMLYIKVDYVILYQVLAA